MATNESVQRWLDERFVPAGDKYVQDLDKMALQYVVTLLWAETTEAPEGSGTEPLDESFAPEDLSPEFWQRVCQDVWKFVQADLDGVWRHNPELAGHDLWLSRNGHGAGFFDGDWSQTEFGDAGDYLQKLAEGMGEVWVYIGDDGVLYYG